MDGWVDRLQLWLAEHSNPPAFGGSKWGGVSAPQHNQWVEAEQEGNQQHGVVGTSVRGEDACPQGGCSRQGHGGVPTPGGVSWPRLQTPSRGFDAIGFSRRSSKAQGGGHSRCPLPPSWVRALGDQPLLRSPHPERGRMAAAGRRRSTIPAHTPRLRCAGL